MTSNRRKKLTKGLLSKINLAAVIPQRHVQLYYTILEELQAQDNPGLDAMFGHLVAMTFCRLLDCFDMNYLFSRRVDLQPKGQRIMTNADSQEKQFELTEVLPVLQRSLVGWSAALREGRKVNTSQQSELHNILEHLDS